MVVTSSTYILLRRVCKGSRCDPIRKSVRLLQRRCEKDRRESCLPLKTCNHKMIRKLKFCLMVVGVSILKLLTLQFLTKKNVNNCRPLI